MGGGTLTGSGEDDISSPNTEEENTHSVKKVSSTAGPSSRSGIKDSTSELPEGVSPNSVRDTLPMAHRVAILESDIAELNELKDEIYDTYPVIETNRRQIEELRSEIEGISQDVPTSDELNENVRATIDTTIHVPLTLGLTIATFLLTVGLLLSGSFISIFTLVISAFGYLNWRRMKSSYQLNTIDVI